MWDGEKRAQRAPGSKLVPWDVLVHRPWDSEEPPAAAALGAMGDDAAAYSQDGTSVSLTDFKLLLFLFKTLTKYSGKPQITHSSSWSLRWSFAQTSAPQPGIPLSQRRDKRCRCPCSRNAVIPTAPAASVTGGRYRRCHTLAGVSSPGTPLAEITIKQVSCQAQQL